MNTLLYGLEAAFASVFRASWHATLIAALILLAQSVFRKQLTPGWRYGLWLLLMVRMLAPVLPQSSVSIFNLAKPLAVVSRGQVPSIVSSLPPTIAGEGAAASVLSAARPVLSRMDPERSSHTPVGEQRPRAPSTRESVASRPDLPRALALTWMLGVCGLACWRMVGDVHFRCRLKRSSQRAEERTELLLYACAQMMGLVNRPRLLETTEVNSPAIFGFWRKRLLLPAGMAGRFTEDELRCVFLHELAHVKRRDPEINGLLSLLQMVHWFNPVLWFVFPKIRSDRELACDALALSRLKPAETIGYGETILKVLEQCPARRPSLGTVGIYEEKSRVRHRIRMIAGFKRPGRWSAVALALIVGLGIVTLTEATRGRPAHSEQPPPAKEPAPAVQRVDQAQGLRVRVVDPQGNAVPAAEVRCQSFDWRGTTDADGRFSWRGLDRAYSFAIQKTGFKRRFTEALAPGKEHVITLERAPVIRGKVVDRQTSESIPKFEVRHAQLVLGPTVPTMGHDEPVIGRAGEFEYSFGLFIWPDSALYVYAEGYAPLISSALTVADYGTQMTFELTREPEVTGKILTPSGAPARNAEVRLWFGQADLRTILPQHRVNTDSQGAFSLPPENGGELIIAHNDGYLEMPFTAFMRTRIATLSPWGHVKGRWAVPEPGLPSASFPSLYIHRMNWTGQHFSLRPDWVNTRAKLNRDGSFEFEDPVPPGEYVLSEGFSLEWSWASGTRSSLLVFGDQKAIRVDPGQTTLVEQPPGRLVIGRVEFVNPAPGTNQRPLIIELRSPSPGPEFSFPGNVIGEATLQELQDYKQEIMKYWLSDEGKARRRSERTYRAKMQNEGTFRVSNVPPGEYFIAAGESLMLNQWPRDDARTIRIPDGPTSDTVDLGTLQLKRH